MRSSVIGRVSVWHGMYVMQHSRGYRLVSLGVLLLQTFSNYVMSFLGTNKPIHLTAFIVLNQTNFTHIYQDYTH